MTLSEYELRVLREIEQELTSDPPPTAADRIHGFLATQWVAITLAGVAVLITISAALFVVPGAAAPLAGLVWALAGYAVCASSRVADRHARRGRASPTTN